MTKKIFFILIVLFFLFNHNTSFASFPTDAINYSLDVDNGTTGTFLTPNDNIITILQASLFCSSQKDFHLKSSSGIIILDSENNNNIVLPMLLKIPAGDSILWDKPLNPDKCFFHIVYVDYDISIGGITTTNNTEFTAGDLVIGLFLLIIILLILVYFLRSAINSVPVVRHFQGNNSQDGKEFYDI